MDRSEQLDHLRLGAEIAGLTPPEFRLPDDRDVLSDRLRIHLLDWGPVDAPPIVFVHGGSLTAHTWDLVCLMLRDRYRCVAVDLRGHGESAWAPDADYRFETMAADVSGVIDALELDRPVLVGMSLGGLTSIRLACDVSDDALRGLVIVDVGPDMRLDAAREIVDFTQHDQELDSVDDFVARAMRFNSTREPELLRRSLLYNLRRLPNGRWTWKWDHRRLRNADLERMQADHARLWDVVGGISCPTLIVRGERSRVFLDEDGRKLAGAIPDASFVVVPDAGHTVQGDNPRGLLEVLEPFLASCFEAAAR